MTAPKEITDDVVPDSASTSLVAPRAPRCAARPARAPTTSPCCRCHCNPATCCSRCRTRRSSTTRLGPRGRLLAAAAARTTAEAASVAARVAVAAGWVTAAAARARAAAG
eukprot:scaffold115603_cov69-Phaeocystis_antarctica.AAC.2